MWTTDVPAEIAPRRSTAKYAPMNLLPKKLPTHLVHADSIDWDLFFSKDFTLLFLDLMYKRLPQSPIELYPTCKNRMHTELRASCQLVQEGRVTS